MLAAAYHVLDLVRTMVTPGSRARSKTNVAGQTHDLNVAGAGGSQYRFADADGSRIHSTEGKAGFR